ncbi:hypothetical protein ABPG72_011343 [Tetrahymena utriculariae]
MLEIQQNTNQNQIGDQQSPLNKEPLKEFNGDIEMQIKKDQTSKQENVPNVDEEKQEIKMVTFIQMLRYANKTDWTLMVIGSIASMANGVAFPMFALIFGQMTDSFGPNSTGDDLVDAAGKQSLYFFFIGVGSFLMSWIQLGCWMISGERQSIKFRQEYFKAIINQEIGWFDQINANELASKIATESSQIQGALGEKVPTFLMSICTTIGGFAVGYIRGWQMALVTTAALPVLIIGAISYTMVIQQSQKKISGAYQTSGGLAEQSLNSVKTIKSLTGEEYELHQYSRSLVQAFKIACKYGAYAGAGIGLTLLTMFLDYALSFWYGSKLIADGTENQIVNRVYTQGDIFVIFSSILIGGFSIAQVGPCLKNFEIGKQAAQKIFYVIDRKPLIEISPNANKIPNLQGKIEFNCVEFNYPAKKDIPVHRKLNLAIQPNKKTALVGESGCGKSTVMQLLLRFYDPDNGSVTIDGYDVKSLDYRWLRNRVGYVGQEPVLFATTIRENLKFGKEDATEEEMIQALKQANAWEFVQLLENQLDTYVGNAGSQISGGQKQRICIARAILKNPQILLLDEATSALDRKNEAMIQQTLDEISKGRTTIVIAHRLSTVKNADEILVLDQGKLVEQGTYEQLIEAQGKFEALAKNQIQKEMEEKQEKKNKKALNEKLHDESIENQIIRKQSSSHAQNNQRKSSLTRKISENQSKELEIQEEKEKKELKLKQKKEDDQLFNRLFDMNKPERKYFYAGMFFTLANGVCFPLSGLILGEFIDVLANPDASDFRTKAGMLSIYFVILGAISQVLSIFQYSLFTRVGEGLTLRVRQELLKKMLKMPGGWFDKPENNPGTLSARLASDAQLINGLTSNIISVQISNFSSLVTGLVIAFVMSWRVALVSVAVCPLIVIAGTIQAKQVEGFSEGSDKAYKDSSMIIMEAVTNIRTVASFSNEKKLCFFLSETLKKPYKLAFKKGHISGIAFGFSQLATFSVYAIIFICSAVFVRDYGVTAREMFVSIFAILNAAAAVGNNNHFMGDVGATKAACREIFKILDSDDEIQIQQKHRKALQMDGQPLISKKVFGEIEFKDVSFKYPTRDAQIFKNLSFKIHAGQKVAFVGPSGSGKSSILQLLLRFYDDYQGQILVDGEDIRNYDIKEFRKNFGVVSQEPILFNGSIAENIKYNTADVTMEDIREAAHKANALSFIETDENQEQELNDKNINHHKSERGFDKKVGLKGSQISGGQKQRIAIARAVIKNPNIMLLDEATSALDYENEKIVQEALNKVMKGKTSLCVAHRLSTIADSDQIFVIEGGKLVEQGTYEQLMSKKEYFYRLNAN